MLGTLCELRKKENKMAQKQLDKDKQEEKDLETEELEVTTLMTVIRGYLPNVMVDRKYMPALEKALDDFIAETPKEKRTQDEKKKLVEQMNNASKALESLSIRLIQSY
jgi:uncharacterized protein with ATP-grasp and redox domains